MVEFKVSREEKELLNAKWGGTLQVYWKDVDEAKRLQDSLESGLFSKKHFSEFARLVLERTPVLGIELDLLGGLCKRVKEELNSSDDGDVKKKSPKNGGGRNNGVKLPKRLKERMPA